MESDGHLGVVLLLVLLQVLLQGVCSGAFIQIGKTNVTVQPSASSSCQVVRFPSSFSSSGSIKVFASFGHAVQNQKPRDGATIWVESVSSNGFAACVLEFGRGSNGSAEVNWLAFQRAPQGVQHGTVSYDMWTTGTKCKRVEFPKRFPGVSKVFSTPRHSVLQRPQDAMLVWVEDLAEDHFKLCLREVKNFDGPHENIEVDWFAYTDPPINVTYTDSLVFSNLGSPRKENNFAPCKIVNFTDSFYASPVVLVNAKHKHDRSNANSLSPGCNSITAWIEHTSTGNFQVCMKDFSGRGKSQDTVTLDYLVIGELDPCINVTCDYFASCRAFGPFDARCVCRDSCPSYEEPVCSSNGTTFDNECLFEQEMCFMKLNFTVQHPGSCEGFPFQHGRQSIPLQSSPNCVTLNLRPSLFYPDKPVHVQVSLNYHDSANKDYVHDAAVSWVEEVTYQNCQVCLAHAGHNERTFLTNATVDWMAYQGAPEGGVAGEVRISQWWTGTKCETVKFPSGKFSSKPSVFVTSEHHHAGLQRDATSVWVEDVTTFSFKVCLRELQNYDGLHEDIYVNWLAFLILHKPLFSEHGSVDFANGKSPVAKDNGAFCKDVEFSKSYQNSTPEVFVTANHSTAGGNLDAVHNGITAWLEYINQTGFRVCLKELHETKYDPLSVSYTVLSDICEPGWSFYGGYCYFTSSACANWLSAESACKIEGAHLATVHNQEENVYIQHRQNGQKTWIGLNDRSVEGTFVYSSQEFKNFTYWAKNQPNNLKNEDCVHTLGMDHGYTWNDVSCKKCLSYTCKKDYDECAAQTDGCDVNSVCKNQAGSYQCKVYKTCKELRQGEPQMANSNRPYLLETSSGSVPVYCHMTTLNGCGSGGWTLVMKINGKKSTFNYDSSYWQNKNVFNMNAGISGLDDQETKLPTYWSTPFSKICLGMRVGGQTRFILLNQGASSLYSLIADGKYRPTSLSRNTWKSLVPNSSLQYHCGRQGFNAFANTSRMSKARIGITNNNENDCSSNDSRLGFGTGGYPDNNQACGNVAKHGGDIGVRSIPAMGYIFVM